MQASRPNEHLGLQYIQWHPLHYSFFLGKCLMISPFAAILLLLALGKRIGPVVREPSWETEAFGFSSPQIDLWLRLEVMTWPWEIASVKSSVKASVFLQKHWSQQISICLLKNESICFLKNEGSKSPWVLPSVFCPCPTSAVAWSHTMAIGEGEHWPSN